MSRYGIFLLGLIFTVATEAGASGCSIDVLNALLPAPFQVHVTDDILDAKKYHLRSECFTDAQIEALVYSWQLDVSIRTFLRDPQSDSVRRFLTENGVASIQMQRLVLAGLEPHDLGKAMREPSHLASLHPVLDLFDVFRRSPISVRDAIVADTARLRSPDRIVTVDVSRSYDVAFALLADRSGIDESEVKQLFLRGLATGQFPPNANFGEVVLELVRIANPLWTWH